MTSGKIDGVKQVSKKLADGSTRIYFYHRATMGRLPDDPSSPKFASAVARMDRDLEIQSASERTQTIGTLIRTYESSPDWKGLRESTRTIERFNLKAIEDEFGDMPLAALNEKGVKADFYAWRDEIAEEHPRAADGKMKRLAKVFAFGLEREVITRNPLAPYKSIYKVDRSDMIWTDDQIAAFRAVSGKPLETIMLFALHTGQRRGDLLDLTWSAYDGRSICLRQSKTGQLVDIPCTKELKALCDSLPRETAFVLNSTRGVRWTRAAFRSAWRRAYVDSEISADLHFHDLRGTAATRLAEAGCTVPEIATITGHRLSTVTKILESYLSRSPKLAESAIRKLQVVLDSVSAPGNQAETKETKDDKAA